MFGLISRAPLWRPFGLRHPLADLGIQISSSCSTHCCALLGRRYPLPECLTNLLEPADHLRRRRSVEHDHVNLAQRLKAARDLLPALHVPLTQFRREATDLGHAESSC